MRFLESVFPNFVGSTMQWFNQTHRPQILAQSRIDHKTGQKKILFWIFYRNLNQNFQKSLKFPSSLWMICKKLFKVTQGKVNFILS